MKVFTSDKQKTGEIGESVVCTFLIKHGHEILERNYTKKWGEIDIVTRSCLSGKQVTHSPDNIHFIEVKSIKVGDLAQVKYMHYDPAQNMHPMKTKKMLRTIETYLLERKVSYKTKVYIDLACAYLDMTNKTGRVVMYEDLIL